MKVSHGGMYFFPTTSTASLGEMMKKMHAPMLTPDSPLVRQKAWGDIHLDSRVALAPRLSKIRAGEAPGIAFESVCCSPEMDVSAVAWQD